MVREVKVALHAVNIVTHPHSRHGYEALALAIMRARQPVQVFGDRHALMTSLSWASSTGTAHRQVAVGIISTFTQIDANSPWLNVKTGDAAEESETETISIPNHLRPNLAQFRFWFDLEKHVLVVQGSSTVAQLNGRFKRYSFSPSLISRYLEVLFKLPKILELYKSIELTIIPDSESIARILNSRGLRSITLTIKPPNTDTLGTLRGRVMQRLNGMEVKTKIETYVAISSQNIQPDDELKDMARLAATNGRVDAKIATESDGVVPVSTAGKPLVQYYTLHPDLEEEASAFAHHAGQLASNIASRRRLEATMAEGDVKLTTQLNEYWTAYGGATAVRKSGFFWLSLAITCAAYRFWSEKEWWSIVLATIPPLMGVSLAAFTLFLGAGSEKFRRLIAGNDPTEEPTTQEAAVQPSIKSIQIQPSPFVKTAAVFVHFVVIQFLAIFIAFLASSLYLFKAPAALADVNEVVRQIFWGVGCFFFIYSLCTALAATLAVFEVVRWFDAFVTQEKKADRGRGQQA